MNNFKLARAAAKNEKLSAIFTAIFLIFGLVFWALAKLNIGTEFFQFLATIMGYGSFGFLMGYVICNVVRYNAEDKLGLKSNAMKN